jgi:hypothetical protein
MGTNYYATESVRPVVEGDLHIGKNFCLRDFS